jgi:hypothetical protein
MGGSTIMLFVIIIVPKFLLLNTCPINLNHLSSHFKYVKSIRVVMLENDDLANWIIKHLHEGNVTITLEKKFLVKNYENTHHTTNTARFDPIELDTVLRFLRTDSVNGHLIIVQSEEVLQHFLEENHTMVVPQPRDYYSIVLIDSYSNILSQFWLQYQVSNIILQSCASGTTYIFSPFVNSTYILGGNYTRGTNLMNFNQHEIRISMKTRPPTSVTKFPKLLQVNPVYANLDPSKHFAGIDGSLLRTILDRLNFKFEVFDKDMSYGEILENGTVTGLLGLVANNQVQISANGRFIMDYGIHNIEFTVPYSSDQICAVVPKAPKVPELVVLAHCFSLSSWLMIGFIFIVSTLIWYLMGDCGTDWWQIYAVLHGIPVKIVPSSHQMFFLMSCMVLNIIIVGLIEGSFYQVFSTVTYYKDIDSLKELDESGLPIAPTLFSFAADKSKIMTSFERKKVPPTKLNVLPMVAFHRNMTKFERKRDLQLLLKTDYLDKNGEPLLHMVNECLITFFVSFVVPRNSVFLPTLNEIISRAFETGLTLKWYQDVEFSTFLEKIQKRPRPETRVRSFSIHDIKAAFYVLLSGLLASLAVFSLEVVLKMKWRRFVKIMLFRK